MKKTIIKHCELLIQGKLEGLKRRLAELQASANEDSKSAMGDKYETGRAMIHLEQENITSQSEQFMNQLKVLSQVSIEEHHIIQLGSLVATNHGKFFISIGLGAIQIEGESIFLIAPTSPIGGKMIGCKQGAVIQFNDKHYELQAVC